LKSNRKPSQDQVRKQMKKALHIFSQNLPAALIVLLAVMLLLQACSERPEVTLNTSRSLPEHPIVSFTGEGEVPGRYIVFFKDELIPNQTFRQAPDAQQRTALVRSAVEDVLVRERIAVGAIHHVFSEGIKGASFSMDNRNAELLKASPLVSLVEPDQLYSLGLSPSVRPPLTPTGDSLKHGQVTDYGVLRVGGSRKASGNRKVWILDTGIDSKHKDLDVDKNSCVRFITKTQVVGLTGSSKGQAEDFHGHGTHVAGIIGAKDNNRGVVGVASGVKIVAVKVIDDDGHGLVSDAIAGLNYVASHANPYDVVNLSFGGLYSQALNQAVLACQAASNVRIVIAAGNENTNAALYSPGGLNGPGIFTIASVSESDVFSSFSNFGTSVDYAAPGEDILSTWPGDQYAFLSGTSMAAPLAAGVLVHCAPNINPRSNGFSIGATGKIYRIISRK
jgi:hypothetical protein